jgi:hypothetical protein
LKVAFQADANLDPDIVRGLCRREPSIDFRDRVGVIADSMPDPAVLRLAVDSGRVLVSSDVHTMLAQFLAFIAHAESPGLILVPSSRSIGSVIEGILVVWVNWTPNRLRNQAMWLPIPVEPMS